VAVGVVQRVAVELLALTGVVEQDIGLAVLACGEHGRLSKEGRSELRTTCGMTNAEKVRVRYEQVNGSDET
jgi:hypothetical protein